MTKEYFPNIHPKLLMKYHISNLLFSADVPTVNVFQLTYIILV